MSLYNSPKPNKAGRRCTVCYSATHNRSFHAADERRTTRTTEDAPRVERQYHDKEKRS